MERLEGPELEPLIHWTIQSIVMAVIVKRRRQDIYTMHFVTSGCRLWIFTF
jgi:hypothetical protein